MVVSGVLEVNQLVRIESSPVPALVSAAGDKAGTRFLEFFAANIRNPHAHAPGL